MQKFIFKNKKTAGQIPAMLLFIQETQVPERRNILR